VLYGNVQWVGNTDRISSGSIYDGPFNFQKLLNRNICHQAIFYRTDLVRRAGSFNLDYPIWADWDFNLRCWALTTFKYIDLVVAKFRADGISSNSDDRFQRDIGVRVVRYFGFSLLNPVVNDRTFIGRPEIIEMQKANGKLYALFGLALRVILKVRWEARTGLRARLARFLAGIRAL
jgi:hypothetical protein